MPECANVHPEQPRISNFFRERFPGPPSPAFRGRGKRMRGNGGREWGSAKGKGRRWRKGKGKGRAREGRERKGGGGRRSPKQKFTSIPLAATCQIAVRVFGKNMCPTG